MKEENGRLRVLLIGYGNPGRLDDGLGPALAEMLEKKHLPGLTVDADYQLTVEHSKQVADHDVVIFADASINGEEPFFFKPLPPRAAMSFSSHSVEPQAVLAMAQDLFHSPTRGFALGIRGYEFNEFGERLSEKASQNLKQAETFLLKVLQKPTLLEAEVHPN